jgi:PAS domain S-box-containing protein
MWKYRVYLSAVVLFLSLATALSATSSDELKIVYNLGVAPLKFEDTDSRPAGLLPDFWRLWAQKAGKEIQFVRAESFQKSLQLIKDGKGDLHAGLFKTPEREEFLGYSEPLLALDYYIFTHPSVYPIKSLEKTSGFIVGVQKGGYTEQFVRVKVPGDRIAVYDRFQDLFRAALEGEIRVFVATELSLFYYLKENFFTNIFEHDPDHPLYSQEYYTATKKGNPALIEQVNDGLKAIGSEEKKQLEDKWIVRDFQDVPQEPAAAPAEQDKLALTDAEKSWLDAHPVIRVATEDLPPYTFQENYEAYGYTVDLMQMMAKKVGFQFEIEFLPPDEAMAAIKNNKVELTLNQGYSEERAAHMLFGKYPFRVKTAIFAKTDRADILNLETLAGKTCAGTKGSVVIQTIQEKYPQIRIVPTESMFDALKMVSVGQADAAIMESNMGQYLLRKYDITDVHLAGFTNLFGKEGARASYWAVAKDHAALKLILDKAYDSLDREERQRLWKKWFQFDVAAGPGPPKRINLSEQEAAWLDAHPVIRVHNEKDWPPFNYFDYGKPRGLSIDYMNLVAKQLGIKVEYITGPSWNEFLGMVNRKELDVMLNIVKTEDRMKYLLYTEPYIKNPNVIVSSQANPYETIQALFGKTVAFPKGFFYEEVLTKSFPQIKRLPVEDTLASLKAVAFGRADAALGEAAVVRTLINKNFISGLQISGEVNIGDPDLMNLRIGVRNDWPLLQSALMKAMAAIAPQEMNQIQQKWIATALDSAAAPQTAVTLSYGRLIVYGIAVFLALSLLAWILIKTVKKENIAVSFGSRWFRGLVLAGLSIFIIIVCLLGWFTLEKNKENILEDIADNLTESLNTADDRINLWVEQRTTYLKLLGRDPKLVTLIKRLLAVKPDRESLLTSDALRETRAFFKTNKEIFANIGFFIINTDDISIGSRRDTNIGSPNLISRQRPDLLRRAFEGEVLFVPPIESDVPLGEGPKADGARNPSTKFFMGPIRDPNGQIIAVMTLRVDPSEDFSRVLTSSEMRQTFETYAFNEHGELLSESRFDEQLRRIGLIGEDQRSAANIVIRDPGVNLVAGQRPKIERSQQPLTRMASRAVLLKANMEKAGQTYGHSKIEIDTEGYRDYRGVPVFGAWLWNADLELGLATEIDVAEAMSNYYQIRRTVFGILGFTLLLSVGTVLLVLILGERTSRALMKARDNLEATVDERTAELQEKQRQLEAAVERSGLILESAGEGIFGVDLDGKVAFINPAANRMLGYESDDLIGQAVHQKIHHSHADGSGYPKEECPMYRSHVDGTAHHVTDEVLWHKDGTPFPVEYTSMPIKKDGRVVGAVVTFMDITERKKIESALLEERERLQKILDTSPVGVGISTEGVVRFANPRFAELFDRKEGEAAHEAYVNPKDREHIVSELKSSGIVRDYELQTYGRDREIRDTLATFISTEYEGQNGILSWMVDLGGLKEAERELKAKFDELARFRRLAIGREQKMIELKKEINELMKTCGMSEKYKIH